MNICGITGETTQTITITSVGTYGVTVSNSCGDAYDDITLNLIGQTPNVDFGPDVDFCDESFPITIDAGDFDSYTWNSGESSQIISAPVVGTYGVTVSNVCGSAYGEVTIGSSESIPQPNLGLDEVLCPTDFPITLDAGVADSFLWSTGEITQTISINAPGIYSVDATSTCGTGSDELEIIMGASISQPNLGPDLTICPSDFPITLDAGLADSYLWSTGESSQTISVNAAGTYSVDAFSECGTGTDEVTIIVDAAGPQPNLGLDITACLADFPITLDAGVADSFLWSTGEITQAISINAPGIYSVDATSTCGTGSDELEIIMGASIPQPDLGENLSVCPADFPITLDAGLADSYLWSTGESSQTISVNAAGTYSVDAFSECGTGTDEVTIIVDAAGPQPNLGLDITACLADFPITLDAGVADSFLWSTGEITQTISINAPGIYSVDATSTCGTGSDELEIIMGASIPQPDLGPDLTICPSDFPITLDVGLADSYLWSTGESSQTISVNAAGTYSVDAFSECGTGTDEVTIIVDAAGPLPSLGPDFTVCTSDFSITLDAGLADNYLWNTGETSQTITIDTVGTYIVDASNLCGIGTDELTITLGQYAPQPNLGPDISVCEIDFPINLDAGVEGTYSWSTDEATQVIIVDTYGQYIVNIESECNITSDTLNIEPVETPTIDLGSDLILCEENFPYEIIASTSTPNVQWHNGSNENSLEILDAGIYWAEVVGSCETVSDSIEVQVYDSEIVEESIEICEGESVEYHDIIINSSGTYSTILYGASTNGCNQTAIVDVNVVPLNTDFLTVQLDFEGEVEALDTTWTNEGIFEYYLNEGGFCPTLYSVTVVDPFEGQALIHIPNAFTPNEDGLNDLFGPVIALANGAEFHTFTFEIYDRDGHTLFRSTDPLNCQWNGQLMHNTAFYSKDDNYNWTLSYSIIGQYGIKEMKGNVTILR